MSAVATEAPPAPTRAYIPNRLLDIQDLAALSHLSEGTIRWWVRTGKCPAPLRLGRLLRWEPSAVEAWLAGA
jgi:predicted DNA-binding transcriptional regulator AlpA